MAITVTVEDGSGLSTSNSFISVADADSYFATHPYSTDWDGLADDDAKAKCLIYATMLLSLWVDWNGVKYVSGQAQAFPRLIPDEDDDGIDDVVTVETWLENATCELALSNASKDSAKRAESDLAGFTKIKVGEIELAADSQARSSLSPFPKIVEAMISGNGSLRSGAHSGKVYR